MHFQLMVFYLLMSISIPLSRQVKGHLNIALLEAGMNLFVEVNVCQSLVIWVKGLDSHTLEMLP